MVAYLYNFRKCCLSFWKVSNSLQCSLIQDWWWLHDDDDEYDENYVDNNDVDDDEDDVWLKCHTLLGLGFTYGLACVIFVSSIREGNCCSHILILDCYWL